VTALCIATGPAPGVAAVREDTRVDEITVPYR
jgi:hypothetical protein